MHTHRKAGKRAAHTAGRYTASLFSSVGVIVALVAVCITLLGCGQAQPSTTKKGSSGSSGEPATLQSSALRLNSGGLAPNITFEVRDLSADETQDVERAVRAYEPTSDESLLVNNAQEFYYYNQLDAETRKMYDALLLAASDPESSSNYVRLTTTTDPSSEEFLRQYYTAYFAMTYDHPELFWLYQGIEDEVDPMAAFTSSKEGRYDVFFALAHPYENYKEEMTAFNKATDELLSQVDLSASDAEIAQQIHDLLIDTVTYDDKVAAAGVNDLAHTAYGVLVQNGNGEANHAVCDGYSLAYEYLLQQAGITAIVMPGKGGATASDAGGHAWNLIELDGEWYEVDSTWDDAGSLDSQIAEALKSDPDDLALTYYQEALADTSYRETVEHALYNVTTDKISSFEPDQSSMYVTHDGRYELSLVGSSVHIRADKTDDMGIDAYVSVLAPEATGTKYQFAS